MYADSPTTEPTDRSTLRVTMTIVSPTPSMRDERGARQQLLDAVSGGEIMVVQRRDAEHHQQHHADADLAGPQQGAAAGEFRAQGQRGHVLLPLASSAP